MLAAVAAAAVAASGAWLIARAFRTGGPDSHLLAREAVLLRQRQGLEALIARAERGPLVPLSGDHAVVVVDQRLVQSLLGALVPTERVVAERYRVRVQRASVSFEDGFALVKLDGRASLMGDDDVYADLSVYGDLDVLRTQSNADLLQARINVVAVEARPMELPIGRDQARDLVEGLSKAKLEEFASLASSLQIPVRQQHAFEVPAVGPSGPIRIEAATVPFRLDILDVTAFHGKLWISMASGVAEAAAPAPAPGLPRAGAHASAEALRARIAALDREHHARHGHLEALLKRDPFVAQATRAPGEMVLAMRSGFVREVVEQLAYRYFDQVAVVLEEIDVHKRGAIERDTFLGRIRAGHWTVALRVHQVKGTLRAGRPRIRFERGNRVAVAVPTRLAQGVGSASLDFSWDARGLANIVCRDFKVTQQLAGTVRPEEYAVRGAFVLAAEGQTLVARPAFNRRFRIKLDLAEGTWAAVRDHLEAQDTLGRCGLGLDPAKVLAELQRLVDRGFDVNIPQRFFRPIGLPAQIAQSVKVDEHEVKIGVGRNALRVTRDALWYSASVDVRLPPGLGGLNGGGPSGAAPESLALLHSPSPSHVPAAP